MSRNLNFLKTFNFRKKQNSNPKMGIVEQVAWCSEAEWLDVYSNLQVRRSNFPFLQNYREIEAQFFVAYSYGSNESAQIFQ